MMNWENTLRRLPCINALSPLRNAHWTLTPRYGLKYEYSGRRYEDQGDYQQAEVLYQRTIALQEQIFGWTS